MSLEITERRAGSVIVLELAGRLTMGEGVEVMDERVQSVVSAGCLSLLLDCSKVTFIDSQGIHVLVRGVNSLEKQGGKLKLLKISPRVRHVLEVTRLLNVIESFDDEEEALRTFAQGKEDQVSGIKERRRSQRVPVSVLAQVETLTGGFSITGRTVDLSESGLFMKASNTPSQGAEVDIRFTLPPDPPGKTVATKGIVVRSQEGATMGINFLLLEDSQRQAIAQFVRTGGA